MKIRTAIFAVCYLLCAVSVLGQSCAMCYGSAQSTSKEGQKAINKGVLVLLVPPICCLTLGVWAAFRYCRQRDFEEATVSGSVYQTQRVCTHSEVCSNDLLIGASKRRHMSVSS